MFRPLIGHHQVVQNLRGDYILGMVFCLGDEISSYNIVFGVKARSRHILCVTISHLRYVRHFYLSSISAKSPFSFGVFTLISDIQIVAINAGSPSIAFGISLPVDPPSTMRTWTVLMLNDEQTSVFDIFFLISEVHKHNIISDSMNYTSIFLAVKSKPFRLHKLCGCIWSGRGITVPLRIYMWTPSTVVSHCTVTGRPPSTKVFKYLSLTCHNVFCCF